MDKFQALHNFWSSFGIPAYDSTRAPEDLEYPYVTYEVSTSDFGNIVLQSANLWYYSTSWKEASQKADEIAEYITGGGRLVKYDGGGMWIRRSSPWAHRLASDTNDMIRIIVLAIEVEFIEQ